MIRGHPPNTAHTVRLAYPNSAFDETFAYAENIIRNRHL